MQTEQRLLQQVIDAHRGGDLDECVRWVRTLVYAAPLATAPRHLLASLYSLTGAHRLALLHYRRLLPPALAKGRENSRAGAAEGDGIDIPSPIVEQLRVSFFPDLPVELLRFDPALAAELRDELVAGRRGQAPSVAPPRSTAKLGPAHVAWT